MPIEPASVPTVRESVESAIESVAPEQPIPAQEPAPQAEVKAEQPQVPAQETEAQKAERLRDEKGRFVEGKPEPKAPEVKAAPVVAPAPPKVPRPSSWKKELEPQWDTLTPELQAYVRQRESEYQTGVSTYKTEADRAKGVMEAIAPFEPLLQQSNIPVGQWLTNLGRAHHTLAAGSPQDKVALVANIIRANNVDGNALFQILSGQQPMPQAPQPPPQPQITQKDIDARIQQAVNEREVQHAYKAFTEAKDEKGQLKYPHVEAVKGTMAGLLQADLAQDYPSAYDAALRMPQHADIWNALQQQQATQKEAERIAAEQAKVGRARSQAVSVRSSTPSQMTQAEGSKSLRDQLSESFDRATASRV